MTKNVPDVLKPVIKKLLRVSMIVLVIILVVVLFVLVGLYFLLSPPPVMEVSCINKPASESVSTWMVDKHGKCIANVCMTNYIHHSGKQGCYPIKATYTSLTPKELKNSACRSVSGASYLYNDFDSQTDTLPLGECKSKCTLNPKCRGVDYESGNCRYFIAPTGPFIGNPDDAHENETCWKKIK